MTSSMMRPGNFRHDMNGPRVVEITMSEYLRSKRSILKKIRRRLVIVGVIISLTAVVALALGIVIQAYHGRVNKFWREAIGLALCFIYFVYAGATLVHSFHGFYLDGHWNSMLNDGNRLIMHLRLYGLCGVITWVLALWLGYATLASFGLVDIRQIVSSSVNIVYLITLVLVCIHLCITPSLLRTIHRKTSQADEYFGAEFMDGVKRSQHRRTNRRVPDEDVGSEDDDGNADEHERYGHDNSDGGEDGIYLEEIIDSRSAGSTVTDPDQLPFASPVFLLDPNRRLEAPEFWRLWKATDTTGSFSCLFRNQPRRKDVEAHLQALGFHVVSADVQDNVLQLCFFACQLGTDVVFLCEFVLIFSRRFFQATFKCSDRETASDFVARFNLQDLLIVDE
ncbi:hypothetical protein P43SY_001200 [Pythium insidiosum]|uniref:Beta-adaptin appendage C-terminal subdomain domain-containing protein n=1 Tax=Pythium insidiosum TaxID=114742 RepID=A0AAD5LL54_PYTIN|nr:hypothetical protein P43SY_001200 [Pythium insidiosum]